MKTIEFKEKMKNDLIPAIEDLIEKESTHLAYMLDARDKIRAKTGYSILSPLHAESEIDLMIGRSSISLNHMKSRLVEYKKYVDKP